MLPPGLLSHVSLGLILCAAQNDNWFSAVQVSEEPAALIPAGNPVSSCPVNTEIVGMNYLKDQPEIVAMEGASRATSHMPSC